jgi:hypothetical protein
VLTRDLSGAYGGFAVGKRKTEQQQMGRAADMENNKRTRKNTDIIERARQLRMQLEEQKAQVDQLEKDVRLARGTARMKRPTNTPNVIVKPARPPHWVGDDGPTGELLLVVHRLLLERPLTFQEILEQTGARDNRVKGVIMRLQREGVHVVDISTSGDGKARWFIPSEEIMKRIERSKRNTEKR